MSLMNRLRLGMDYFRNRQQTDSYPVMVSVEPTNRCNLHCIMCPTNGVGTEDDRDKGEMRMETFQRILEQLDGQVDTIGFIGGGEPLLSANLFDMIRLTKQSGLKATVFSNGLALTESIGERLLEANLDYIHFSVDGITKETYESIRKGSNFERVYKNIQNFCNMKIARNKQLKIYVQLIVSGRTRHEVDRFYDHWRAQPGINHVRLKPILDHLFHHKGGVAEGSRPCFASWYYAHFRWNGDLFFCPQDYMCTMAAGNIMQQTLMEIRNAPAMQQCRQLHAQGREAEIPLCAKCNLQRQNTLEAIAALTFPEELTRTLMSYYEKRMFYGKGETQPVSVSGPRKP